jgi:signal transduction histidine kinase
MTHASVHAQEALHVIQAEVLAVEGYGFSRPPYFADEVELRGMWIPVELPHTLRPAFSLTAAPLSELGPPTVVTWYRVRVPSLSRSNAASLYIPRWKPGGQIAVYGDGRLLYQSHANLLWNGSNLPIWVPLTETAGAAVPSTLLIRMERLRATGGGISSVWINPGEAPPWRYRVRAFLQAQLPAMSSAAFLAVGIFSLFVWLKRRHETLYVLFFSVSLTSYLRTLHYYVGSERLPISDDWFGWLTVNSLFWLIASIHLFLNYLHKSRHRWLDACVLGITALTGIVTLPIYDGVPYLQTLANATVLAPIAYVLLLAMGLSAFILAFKRSYEVRSSDGMLLAGWSALGVMCGVYDWLLQNNYVDIEGAYLGSHAGIGACSLFLYIMFRRYVGAIADVENLNASLESRLKAREAELNANHERLREIQQLQILSQERQRLMQDMHDGMGSSLTTALRAVEFGRMSEAEVAQILKGCIDDLKLAIDSMEPVDSDLLLLLATLRFRLGPRLESTGIALRWKVTSVPALDWLDPKNALHILRILQEAFTNIIKHTRATEICVATETRDDQVIVSVTDNGPGFNATQELEQGGGKGLSNQMRRAQAIGAEVSWVSSEQGTSFALRLPISREKLIV